MTAADISSSRVRPRTNDIVQNYVLPDFSAKSKNRTGYVQNTTQATAANAANPSLLRSPEKIRQHQQQNAGFAGAMGKADAGEDQILQLANERFTVPELLFHPGAVGA